VKLELYDIWIAYGDDVRTCVFRIFDVTATLIVACFLLSGIYRTAFPEGKHDWKISIIELIMLLPFTISAFWLTTRALRKEKSETHFYKFISRSTNISPSHRLIICIVGGIIFAETIKFMAFIIRTIL
jgi:hypothetical protein